MKEKTRLTEEKSIMSKQPYIHKSRNLKEKESVVRKKKNSSLVVSEIEESDKENTQHNTAIIGQFE